MAVGLRNGVPLFFQEFEGDFDFFQSVDHPDEETAPLFFDEEDDEEEGAQGKQEKGPLVFGGEGDAADGQEHSQCDEGDGGAPFDGFVHHNGGQYFFAVAGVQVNHSDGFAADFGGGGEVADCVSHHPGL